MIACLNTFSDNMKASWIRHKSVNVHVGHIKELSCKARLLPPFLTACDFRVK